MGKKKEKYPYQFHKMTFSWGPIWWRYKNPAGQEFEQDFREGFCGDDDGDGGHMKARVGITRDKKYWVEIVDQSECDKYGWYKKLKVYCSEIEWLYEEDMKSI